jgi:GDPmannose 4,6-dehydratase
VDAMWRMLQQPEPSDFVIATGQMHSLERFVESAFTQVGLCAQDHLETDTSLLRPSDITYSVGDASKAEHLLGWVPQTDFDQLVGRLLRAQNEV